MQREGHLTPVEHNKQDQICDPVSMCVYPLPLVFKTNIFGTTVGGHEVEESHDNKNDKQKGKRNILFHIVFPVSVLF